MSRRILRLLAELPPLALTLGVLALLFATARGRLLYPYDLEWMEGGFLAHSWRVLHGLPLYTPPSADWIPYLYPPLYAWVVAAAGAVVGLSPAVGRAVSLLGTAFAAAALIRAARREEVPWGLAVGGAGLYLSCYDDSGCFYDVVRGDGLLMGLLTWAMVSVREARPRLAGVLLVLAFAAKHNAAIFGLPALIWLWKVHGREVALRFALWSVLPALVFTVVMEISTGGLFLVYLLGVPAAHPLVGERVFPGIFTDLWRAMPVICVLVVGFGFAWRKRWRAGGAWWFAQGCLALLFAALMRGHFGGFINVLMPAHWALSLWAVLACGAALRRWPKLALRAALGVVVAAQIWLGRWDPVRLLPTDADLAAGEQIVAAIREIDGPVFSPYAAWIPVLAGKEPSFGLIALWDIDHPRSPLKKGVKEIEKAMEGQYWAAVIAGNDDKLGFHLAEGYERSKTKLKLPGRALYPKTGWARRPQVIYVPKVAEAATEDPTVMP